MIVVNPTNAQNPEMQLRQPNAFLRYVLNNEAIYFFLWVNKYSQGHMLSGSIEQSLRYNHFYGRSYNPSPVRVEGRIPNQTQMNALGNYIRNHHMNMIDGRGAANLATTNLFPLMQFGIPKDNFYIEGWIPTFSPNERRFNPAPPFEFDFLNIKDRHSITDNAVPSSALRRWWSGDMIDNTPIDTSVPQITIPSDD